MVLADTVQKMYTDGQHRWPSVDLDFEVFRHHVEVVVSAEPDLAGQKFGAELYLCCACAARSQAATLEFERVTAVAATAAIRRVRREPEFVSETLRELWDKLLFAQCPKVTEYTGRGPLVVWVRVAAARLAIDRSRALRLAPDDDVEPFEQFGGSSLGAESLLTKARYAELLQQAVERAFQALSVRDRNILRMHGLHRCTVEQIGRAYGVHRATAARWVERARQAVLGSVRRELGVEESALTESEFASIVRLLRSEMDLKIGEDLEGSRSA